MDIKAIKKLLKEQGWPEFRWKQIKEAVFEKHITDFRQMRSLPAEMREALASRTRVLSLELDELRVSENENAAKALLRCGDGQSIETVLISPKPGLWSVCVSSQIGCALGCAFCATGKMGFKRNLTAEEICDQVLFWRSFLREKGKGEVSNIIFMGMGEPFLNWENVSEAIEMLSDPELFGIGKRSISVSTVGVRGWAGKMLKFPQVNLAVSLHTVDDLRRSEIIPANKVYGLKELTKDLEKYLSESNRKVFLEYALIESVNDSQDDCEKLAKFIGRFEKPFLLHVNLIPLNAAPQSALKKPEKERIVRFKNCLARKKVKSTIRKSLGFEIEGACGQLAGKDLKK